MRPISVRNIKPFFYLLAIASLPALISYEAVSAEDLLQIPTSDLSIPGVVQKFPGDVPAMLAATYADLSGAEALSMQFRDVVPHTRGPQDVSLFRQAAPAVVLILAKGGFGSGSLLQGNVIVTNFHVVDHNREVTVVFKPADPSGTPTQDEVVKGDVVKVDVQRDLALVRPRSLPNHSVLPLEVSSQDIEVGEDVRAIGHPKGEEWSYTKGIVSSVRPNYEWSAGPGESHRATVIQTQTPINLGNSGGPLLTDDGKIVGVNSFIKKGAEGLNFAVAANEIRSLLKNPANGMEALNACNQAKIIFEGRNQANTASIRQISVQCDETADITVVSPDDKQKPVFALVDLKHHGKPEGIVFDLHRTGKWNTSVWDPQFDDTFPLKGVHPTGELMPNSFVPRCGNRKPLKDLKCT
jgi:S1-C subfamily serine protease